MQGAGPTLLISGTQKMNVVEKKVLITGVAGFIGRHASRHFSQNGWSVFGVDAAAAENAPAAYLERYSSMRLPSQSLVELIRECRPAVFIHCAGRASVEYSVTHPEADFYGNTVTTFEALEALRRHLPKCRFINLSSAAVYGNPKTIPVDESLLPAPISPYGFHKWQTDLLCQEFATAFGLQTASLRIFSAYGVGLRRQVMWDICRKVICYGRLELSGDGEESRDFVHVQDIALALQALASADNLTGQVYNLGSEREVTIRELSALIVGELGLNIKAEFNGQLGQGIPRNWRADITRLKGIGYAQTIPFELGLSKFVAWCRNELEGI